MKFTRILLPLKRLYNRLMSNNNLNIYEITNLGAKFIIGTFNKKCENPYM